MTIRRRSVGEFDVIDGVRVDPPAEIIASCARDLSELDLCCLVAAALASGSCTIDALAAVAGQPRRGMRTLRQVLIRADHRYESIWEVLLAELHRSCAVAVAPQHVVRTRDGVFVARGDLWLVGTTRLHEYDGDHHATRSQRTSDLRREGRLSRAGWSRRGYAKDDVIHGAVQVLADADHALGRPHDPTRVRNWHTILRPSLFTPSGRATLQQRLGHVS